MASLGGLIALVIAAPLLEESAGAGASDYRRIGYAIIGAVALFGVWPFRIWQRLLAVPWPLVVALAWCWLSLTWSAVPHEAVVRLVLTTIVVWVSFASIRHLGYDRALMTIRVVLAVALLLNYAVVVLYPDVGVFEHQFHGSYFQWQGLMAHKNFAGALCAFTAIVFLFDVERKWRVPFTGVALAAAVFVGFTVSRTSMISGTTALFVGLLVVGFHRQIGTLLGRDGQRQRTVGYGLVAVVFLLVLFFTFRSDALLNLMTDRDALSSRTVIWQQLVRTYADQPWSGVGFGSYWTTPDSAAVPIGRATPFSDVEQGHNGVLDILVELGLPGLVFVFVAVVIWPVRMLARQIPVAPQSAAMAAALLVLCLGANSTESGLLARDSVWSVLLMLTLALIAALAQRTDPARSPWTAIEHRRAAAARATVRRRRGSGASGSPARTSRGRRRSRSHSAS